MTTITDFPAIRPSFLLDFANSGRVDPRVQCTRASTATCFGPDGKLRSVANHVPRVDYDPVTGKCLGLLGEEARTNAIRNNTMVGAVAGAPGTLPTNWVASTPTNGLIREVVGVGSEDGIDYIDVRWSGTATAGSTGTAVAQFEPNAGIAATISQTWSLSAYVRLVGGSLAGINSILLRCTMRDAGGSNLGAVGSANLNVTAAPLAWQRYAAPMTPTDGNTAFLAPFVSIGYTTGAVIDITLRIGLPQMELGAFSTSAIRTSGVALTRAAENIQLPALGNWYRKESGTWVVDYMVAERALSGTETIISASHTTENSRLQVRTGVVAARNTAGTQFETVIPATRAARIATTYGGGKSSTAKSGVLYPEANYTTPVDAQRLHLGAIDTYWAGYWLNGYITRIAYIPAQLTRAQLQRVSTT